MCGPYHMNNEECHSLSAAELAFAGAAQPSGSNLAEPGRNSTARSRSLRRAAGHESGRQLLVTSPPAGQSKGSRRPQQFGCVIPAGTPACH
jgi:hypothetical protein